MNYAQYLSSMIYFLSRSGEIDSDTLECYALDESGLMELVTKLCDVVGESVIQDSFRIDYKKKEIHFSRYYPGMGEKPRDAESTYHKFYVSRPVWTEKERQSGLIRLRKTKTFESEYVVEKSIRLFSAHLWWQVVEGRVFRTREKAIAFYEEKLYENQVLPFKHDR